MMRPKGFFVFAFLAALPIVCLSEDDTEEDYSSEDIDLKVSKLRLEGAEYLQKVIKQLQSDRTHTPTVQVPATVPYTHRLYDLDHQPDNYVTPTYNISGPTPVPEIEAEVVHNAPPPVSLSKEELHALYEAALGKVSALQGGSQLPEDPQQAIAMTHLPGVKPTIQGSSGPVSGYYYYYFPITSFLKASNKSPSGAGTGAAVGAAVGAAAATTAAPQQLHATITMMESPNKSMEPLFMAISGFIGMALMFFFSVLFVPKFGKLRSKNAQFKDSPDEVANFAQILLEVMAGRDCGERFACEVVRIFRGIKSNNKPLRVLEIILPPNLAQQVSLIRKVAGKKAKCEYIPCKMKKLKPPLPKPQKPKLVPWKKKQTPHDLWMKHFEKGKLETKQQQQRQRQQTKNGGGTRKPPAKRT